MGSLKLVLLQIVLITVLKILIMKDTDNMKEITNKNIDSNKQIRESTEKDVRRKEKIIRNVSENCKNAPFEKISENDKTNFKRNFEKDFKNLRKKTCIKLLWGK